MRYLPNRAIAQDQSLQEFEGVYQANIKCQCSFRHQASMDSRHKILFGVRWSPPVVGKPHILECVGNNHGFTTIDDVSAKGGVPRRLLGIEPKARFKPLSVFIN